MATRVPPVGVDHPTTVPTNLQEVLEADGNEEARGEDDLVHTAGSDDADD